MAQPLLDLLEPTRVTHAAQEIRKNPPILSSAYHLNVSRPPGSAATAQAPAFTALSSDVQWTPQHGALPPPPPQLTPTDELLLPVQPLPITDRRTSSAGSLPSSLLGASNPTPAAALPQQAAPTTRPCPPPPQSAATAKPTWFPLLQIPELLDGLEASRAATRPRAHDRQRSGSVTTRLPTAQRPLNSGGNHSGSITPSAEVQRGTLAFLRGSSRGQGGLGGASHRRRPPRTPQQQQRQEERTMDDEVALTCFDGATDGGGLVVAVASGPGDGEGAQLVTRPSSSSPAAPPRNFGAGLGSSSFSNDIQHDLVVSERYLDRMVEDFLKKHRTRSHQQQQPQNTPGGSRQGSARKATEMNTANPLEDAFTIAALSVSKLVALPSSWSQRLQPFASPSPHKNGQPAAAGAGPGVGLAPKAALLSHSRELLATHYTRIPTEYWIVQEPVNPKRDTASGDGEVFQQLHLRSKAVLFPSTNPATRGEALLLARALDCMMNDYVAHPEALCDGNIAFTILPELPGRSSEAASTEALHRYTTAVAQFLHVVDVGLSEVSRQVAPVCMERSALLDALRRVSVDVQHTLLDVVRTCKERAFAEAKRREEYDDILMTKNRQIIDLRTRVAALESKVLETEAAAEANTAKAERYDTLVSRMELHDQQRERAILRSDQLELLDEVDVIASRSAMTAAHALNQVLTTASTGDEAQVESTLTKMERQKRAAEERAQTMLYTESIRVMQTLREAVDATDKACEPFYQRMLFGSPELNSSVASGRWTAIGKSIGEHEALWDHRERVVKAHALWLDVMVSRGRITQRSGGAPSSPSAPSQAAPPPWDGDRDSAPPPPPISEMTCTVDHLRAMGILDVTPEEVMLLQSPDFDTDQYLHPALRLPGRWGLDHGGVAQMLSDVHLTFQEILLRMRALTKSGLLLEIAKPPLMPPAKPTDPCPLCLRRDLVELEKRNHRQLLDKIVDEMKLRDDEAARSVAQLKEEMASWREKYHEQSDLARRLEVQLNVLGMQGHATGGVAATGEGQGSPHLRGEDKAQGPAAAASSFDVQSTRDATPTPRSNAGPSRPSSNRLTPTSAALPPTLTSHSTTTPRSTTRQPQASFEDFAVGRASARSHDAHEGEAGAVVAKGPPEEAPLGQSSSVVDLSPPLVIQLVVNCRCCDASVPVVVPPPAAAADSSSSLSATAGVLEQHSSHNKEPIAQQQLMRGNTASPTSLGMASRIAGGGLRVATWGTDGTGEPSNDGEASNPAQRPAGFPAHPPPRKSLSTTSPVTISSPPKHLVRRKSGKDGSRGSSPTRGAATDVSFVGPSAAPDKPSGATPPPPLRRSSEFSASAFGYGSAGDNKEEDHHHQDGTTNHTASASDFVIAVPQLSTTVEAVTSSGAPVLEDSFRDQKGEGGAEESGAAASFSSKSEPSGYYGEESPTAPAATTLWTQLEEAVLHRLRSVRVEQVMTGETPVNRLPSNSITSASSVSATAAVESALQSVSRSTTSATGRPRPPGGAQRRSVADARPATASENVAASLEAPLDQSNEQRQLLRRVSSTVDVLVAPAASGASRRSGGSVGKGGAADPGFSLDDAQVHPTQDEDKLLTEALDEALKKARHDLAHLSGKVSESILSNRGSVRPKGWLLKHIAGYYRAKRQSDATAEVERRPYSLSVPFLTVYFRRQHGALEIVYEAVHNLLATAKHFLSEDLRVRQFLRFLFLYQVRTQAFYLQAALGIEQCTEGLDYSAGQLQFANDDHTSHLEVVCLKRVGAFLRNMGLHQRAYATFLWKMAHHKNMAFRVSDDDFFKSLHKAGCVAESVQRIPPKEWSPEEVEEQRCVVFKAAFLGVLAHFEEKDYALRNRDK